MTEQHISTGKNSIHLSFIQNMLNFQNPNFKMLLANIGQFILLLLILGGIYLTYFFYTYVFHSFLTNIGYF